MDYGLLFATMTLIGYGLSPIFSKQAVAHHDIRSVSLYVHALGTALIFIILGANLDLGNLTLDLFIFIVLTTLIGAINVFVLYNAIVRAPISIVTPVVSINNIIVVILSIFLFNESLSMWRWIGVGLTLIGGYTIIAEYHKLKGNKLHKKERTGVMYALLSALLFIVFNIGSKYITDDIGGVNSTLILEFFVFFFMIVIALVFKYRFKIPKKGPARTNSTLSGLFFALGAGFFYVAIEGAGLAITIGLISGAPAVSAIVGRVFLKERLGLRKNIGVVLVLMGIIIVQLL